MVRLAFGLVVIATAAAMAACTPAERQPAQEQTSDTMNMMMQDTAMMSDSGHMMAGDTAARM